MLETISPGLPRIIHNVRHIYSPFVNCNNTSFALFGRYLVESRKKSMMPNRFGQNARGFKQSPRQTEMGALKQNPHEDFISMTWREKCKDLHDLNDCYYTIGLTVCSFRRAD